MKRFKQWLSFTIVALGVTSTASAACQNDSFHDERRQRDFEAVQEFVNSKRTIPLEEKDCNLSISGDIRVRWAYIDEEVTGCCGKEPLRSCNANHGSREGTGESCSQSEKPCIHETPVEVATKVENGSGLENGSCIPYTHNAFDVEFNLYFDYVCDRAWGVAWLQFDNDAGIFDTGLKCGSDKVIHTKNGTGSSGDKQGLFGSGCCDDLCLRKAYIGYNLCADGCQRIDIEVGRRPLYNVFDSRVQFQNNFDGILFRYGRKANQWGDFYWNLGFFVIDERADHYGYVTEIGLLNAWCCKLDVKYSFIDWKSLNGCDCENRCHHKNPRGANAQVHQWTAAYTHQLECWDCKPLKFYGAFLWNSASKKHHKCDWECKDDDKDRNCAWYIGAILGEVCREGDWALDFTYQQVQAYAFPESDFGGIGANGNNVLGRRYFDSKPGTAGCLNYCGVSLEGLYALTDNLSINGLFEWSQEDDKALAQYKGMGPGEHDYWKFELAAIYAF